MWPPWGALTLQFQTDIYCNAGNCQSFGEEVWSSRSLETFMWGREEREVTNMVVCLLFFLLHLSLELGWHPWVLSVSCCWCFEGTHKNQLQKQGCGNESSRFSTPIFSSCATWVLWLVCLQIVLLLQTACASLRNWRRRRRKRRGFLQTLQQRERIIAHQLRPWLQQQEEERFSSSAGQTLGVWVLCTWVFLPVQKTCRSNQTRLRRQWSQRCWLLWSLRRRVKFYWVWRNVGKY